VLHAIHKRCLCTKSVLNRLIVITPETAYDQTAIDLPPVTPAVFLIAKSFWSNVGVLKGYLYVLTLRG
jgi:hypothetical protein